MRHHPFNSSCSLPSSAAEFTSNQPAVFTTIFIMPSFLYCSECNNLLYPREDRANPDVTKRSLMFACRNCDYQEKADNQCVYRNEIVHAPAEQTLLVQDLSTDPTLPRTRMRCAVCSHEEAVFFQAQGSSAEMKMTLYYICCNRACGHRWFS